MSVLRPLPPRPSLEFDRKAAKAFLHQIVAGDPEALKRARAQHSGIDVAAPSKATLSDAQLIIAREYGFASWLRLVQYHRGVELQSYDSQAFIEQLGSVELWDNHVQSLLKQHKARYGHSARTLAAYVPRFFGMRTEDVFDSVVTEDDVRLAIARSTGNPSWAVLMEKVANAPPERADYWEISPLQLAVQAMRSGNLPALQQIAREHPELLQPSTSQVRKGETLLNRALHVERDAPQATRPIVDWLVAQGFDLQLELNHQLCGRAPFMKADDVRYLLQRGANPNWEAPNGLTVLEHAIVRYWNGEAVDVLAPHVEPRQALWISAGLGDVEGVRKLLDRDGRPTEAARAIRLPLDAISMLGIPPVVEPEDEELLMEALYLAVLNGRTHVIEYLASRGCNVNSMVWGSPVITTAVFRGWMPVVESLLRCGADVNLKGWDSSFGSARESARSALEGGRYSANSRRIAELCGLNAEAIIAEREAKAPAVPAIQERMQKSLAYAMQDALRQGRAEVHLDNLLYGMLRFGSLPLLFFTQWSRMDRQRFNAEMMERIQSIAEPHENLKLRLHSDAQAIIDDATAIAAANPRRDTVNALHVLYAMTRDGKGFAAELLVKYDGDLAELNGTLKRSALGVDD